MDSHACFQSIFTSRYKSSKEMLALFSEEKRILTWRQLWVLLAQSEKELGLSISDDQIKELEDNMNHIDWALAAEKEKATRHDVMAHIHAFQDRCPNGGKVLHLGATSAFVQDNADLIITKEATEMVLQKLACCIDRLRMFALKWKDLPTVGRTHYQAASITTVGKRACLWCQELLLALHHLEGTYTGMRFRGIKGATGTYDSFLMLFDGVEDKVRELNSLVTKRACFENCFPITGQTYPRLQDALVMNALSIVAAAVHKICMDVRMLQAFGEIEEPFEATQVGSSAMPYKRNPIRSERCCGFARYLMNLAPNALQTASIQGFERTLDDSSNRRIILPDAFLTADALLATFQNICEGLHVNETVIRDHIDENPALMVERIMMELVKRGKDRQEAHEKIREITLNLTDKGTKIQPTKLIEVIKADHYFDSIKDMLTGLSYPLSFTGLSAQDTQKFISDEVDPVLLKYQDRLSGKSELQL